MRSPPLIGALFAFQQVAIYPERLFSVEITVLMVAMAVIGGPGTVVGPVIGAVGLQLLAEYLRQRYLGLHLIVFGSLVLAVVVLMPEGLVSTLSRGVAGTAPRAARHRPAVPGVSRAAGGRQRSSAASAA